MYAMLYCYIDSWPRSRKLDIKLNAKKQKVFERAKSFCVQQGVRFTPLRASIYKILLNEDSSIGAYDLLDKLKLIEDSAKPPTVYRALEFFISLGMVHKVESTNTFKACYHFGDAHPVQFLICEQCNDVQEICSDGVEMSFQALAKKNNFVVKKQTIEAHGICSKCHDEENC